MPTNQGKLDRRAFLTTLGRCAGGACLFGGLHRWTVGETLGAQREGLSHEVRYYERLPDGDIQCAVCPHACILPDGKEGFCRARVNVAGVHRTVAYNNPCIINVDPIEKLPLNHFRPGSTTLTVACGGCNLRCLYCQNWQQSQKPPHKQKTFELSPDQAVDAARRRRINTIAFSYTEPVAFLEYAADVAARAKRAGMRVVLASAGHVNPQPLLDFAKYVDAFAITLKGFDEDFYQRMASVSLKPVLAAIETIKHKTDCWLELINLVVPTYNDDLEQIEQMGKWVHAALGDDVPLHFARFVPMYRLDNLPRTSVQVLEAARALAHEAGLRYVYTSNVAPHEGTNTVCDKCGQRLIERLGFKVLDNHLERGKCPNCRNRLPGVWR
jgi:pyruvate formate lyase activating enzyme